MSYLTRHFQMRGGIVGSMPNHTAREFMHKKLHGVGVPRKALIAYSKAVIGSTAVRVDIARKLNADMIREHAISKSNGHFSGLHAKKPSLAASHSDFSNITIGSTHRPKRANQHTKDITVTGFLRVKGESLVCYTQGDKAGSMRITEWREKVRP